MSNQNGLEAIKMAAHIFREYDAGHMSDFTAQFLLQRLPQLAGEFALVGNGRDPKTGEPTRATYEMACRLVLEENEMAHDYKGYGTYMTPIDKDEAKRLFENGGGAYNIYDGDAEGEISDGADLERFSFFAADADTSNIYKEKEDFETETLNKELTRRFAAIGYEFTDSHGNERVSRNGKPVADIEGGELVFHQGLNDKNSKVDAGELYNVSRDVHEYTQAYLRALSKDDRLTNGYYRLFEHNGVVMGAAEKSSVEKALGRNGGFKFVTWRKDHDGEGYNTGNYGDDYTAAKEDFALRSGLIRKDRVLTEKELTVVRSSLSEYINLDPSAYDREKDNVIKGVIEKIDSVIEPQAEERDRNEAEFDNENENEAENEAEGEEDEF